jgi:hypothetical protein
VKDHCDLITEESKSCFHVCQPIFSALSILPLCFFRFL